MSISSSRLLEEIAGLGLTISVVDDYRLRLRGPKEACAIVASRIATDKAGLLAALKVMDLAAYAHEQIPMEKKFAEWPVGSTTPHGVVCISGHLDRCQVTMDGRICARCVPASETPENAIAMILKKPKPRMVSAKIRMPAEPVPIRKTHSPPIILLDARAEADHAVWKLAVAERRIGHLGRISG